MNQNITSASNPLIKQIYKNVHDQNYKWILIDSYKVFKQLDLSNHVIYVLCTQKWFDEYKKEITKFNAIITTKEIIDKISFKKNNHSSVIFILDYKLSSFPIKPNRKYIFLDNIQDPGNMANIIRTSVGLGCTELFISNNSVNPLNEKVISSSVGSIFKIKVNFYDNGLELLKELKQKYHYFIIASCLQRDSIKLNEYKKVNSSFVLLVGNEGNGLSREIIDFSNLKLFIKINHIDSLNVASAYAILLHWLISHQD